METDTWDLGSKGGQHQVDNTVNQRDWTKGWVWEQETSLITGAMICQFNLTHPCKASQNIIEFNWVTFVQFLEIFWSVNYFWWFHPAVLCEWTSIALRRSTCSSHWVLTGRSVANMFGINPTACKILNLLQIKNLWHCKKNQDYDKCYFLSNLWVFQWTAINDDDVWVSKN